MTVQEVVGEIPPCVGQTDVTSAKGVTGQFTQLTGSFDGDLEFSGSCSFSVNLEVGGLLHPQAFGLQATPLRPAQVGVTGCRQEVTQ